MSNGKRKVYRIDDFDKPIEPPREEAPLTPDYLRGITHTVEVSGKELELQISPDFEFITQERGAPIPQLRSDDYIVAYQNRIVGRIMADTGELAMEDPGFWEKAVYPTMGERIEAFQRGEVSAQVFPQPLKLWAQMSEELFQPRQVTEDIAISPAQILSMAGLIGTVAIAAPTALANFNRFIQGKLPTIYKHLPGATLRGFPKPPTGVAETKIELAQYRAYQKTALYREWQMLYQQSGVKSTSNYYKAIDSSLFRAYQLQEAGNVKAAQQIVDQIRYSTSRFPGAVPKGREVVPYKPPAERGVPVPEQVPAPTAKPPTIQTGKALEMTLYRGTSELTPFDKGWFALGETWGTRETAEWYAGAGGKGQVSESNVKLENPYVITVTDEGEVIGNKALEGVASRARKKVGATTPEAEDAARKAVTNYIKRKGHDALVVYMDDGSLREVVLFDPDKAKAGVPTPTQAAALQVSEASTASLASGIKTLFQEADITVVRKGEQDYGAVRKTAGGGFYRETDDKIYVADRTENVSLHELGHRAWVKQIPASLKKTFHAEFNKLSKAKLEELGKQTFIDPDLGYDEEVWSNVFTKVVKGKTVVSFPRTSAGIEEFLIKRGEVSFAPAVKETLVAERVSPERPFPAPEEAPVLFHGTRMVFDPGDIKAPEGGGIWLTTDKVAAERVTRFTKSNLAPEGAVEGVPRILEYTIRADAKIIERASWDGINSKVLINEIKRAGADGMSIAKVTDITITAPYTLITNPSVLEVVKPSAVKEAGTQIVAETMSPERPFPAPEDTPALEGIALVNPKTGEIITPSDVVVKLTPDEMGRVGGVWGHDIVAFERQVRAGDEEALSELYNELPRITHNPATDILSIRYDLDNYLREVSETLSQGQYQADLEATVGILQSQFPGKGISIPETGEFFPAKVPSEPTATARLPDDVIENPEVATRSEAIREIEKEYLTPIPESKLDVAMTAILKDGDFDKMVKELPSTWLAKEKKRIRLVDFAHEEFKTFQEFYDLNYVSGYWADPTRMIMAIDNGVFGNPLQKFLLFPTRRATLAKLTFGDATKAQIQGITERYNLLGRAAKPLRQLGFDVLEQVSREEAGAVLRTIIDKEEVQALVGHLPREQQREIVAWCQELRQFYDDMIDKVNKVRLKRGEKPIEYRANYAPYIREVNIFSRLRGLLEKSEDVMQRPAPLDFHVPTTPWNPRALARKGGMEKYLKEKDLLKLTNEYIETAMKDIFDASIVQNAKVYVAALREKGLESPAKLVEEWVAVAFAGQRPIITRAAEAFVPKKTLKSAYAVRRMLTRAVFPLNWQWNLFVQTSSSALTVHRYGIRSGMEGLGYLFNSEAKDYVREAYSWVIKSRYGGKVAYQDLGENLSRVLATEGTLIEKGEHALNFLTNTLEEKLTGISIWAAYNHGKRLGLEGRNLLEYASNGGAFTQSMYNLQDLPGVLRNKPIGTLAPFQTFAFEVFNTAREIGILRFLGKTGEYQTIAAGTAGGKALMSKRIKMLLEWVAAAVVINLVVDKMINRRPWNLSSFVPFLNILLGGVNAGNPWNMPLPMQYSGDFTQGLRNAIEYGDFNRLRKWLIRYHVPAGTQINRAINGIIAINEGKVSAVDGDVLHKVEPDEWLKAILMGTSQTRGGKEYIDKLTESKGGIWFELLGFKPPDFSRFFESKKKKTYESPSAPREGKYKIEDFD